jgi:hypothetical protein
MAADTDLQRRVPRLENETESIYELITAIQTTQAEHTQRFDGMDKRFDGIDKRLDGMDQRFDGIETTLREVVRRLPEPA